MNRTKTGTLVLLALALLLLGGLAGGLLGYGYQRGSLVSWQPLPPLPTRPVKILAAGTGMSRYAWFVYVQTSDQRVYYCPPYAADPCWEESAWPQDVSINPPCDPPLHFSVPSPPRQVVDSLQMQACNFEAGYQVNLAILEDGRVWKWQHVASGLLGLTFLVGGTCCGSIGGLLGGLAIVVIRRRKQRNKDALA